MNKVDPVAASQRFEVPRIFQLGDHRYEYALLQPEFEREPTRTGYGSEIPAMADIPLTDGSTVRVYVEVSAWTADACLIQWADDAGEVLSCWVPAANMHRCAPDQWHGNYLSK
jgi:hypothetical protein